MLSQEENMQQEELKMLRNMVHQLEKILREEQEGWFEEKKGMENEIMNLRDSIFSGYDKINELFEVKKKELEILVSENQCLKKLQGTVQDHLGELNKFLDLMQSLTDTRSHHSNRNEESVIDYLKGEINQLQDKLDSLNDSHLQEIQSLSKNYENQMLIIKEKEAFAQMEAEHAKGLLNQKEKKKQSELGDKDNDIKTLKEELNHIRRILNEKQMREMDDRSRFVNDVRLLKVEQKKKEEQIVLEDNARIQRLNNIISTQNKSIIDLKRQLKREQDERLQKELEAADIIHKEMILLSNKIDSIRKFSLDQDHSDANDRSFITSCLEKVLNHIRELESLSMKEKEMNKSENDFQKIVLEERDRRHSAEIEILKTERNELISRISVDFSKRGGESKDLQKLSETLKIIDQQRIELIEKENMNITMQFKHLRQPTAGSVDSRIHEMPTVPSYMRQISILENHHTNVSVSSSESEVDMDLLNKLYARIS